MRILSLLIICSLLFFGWKYGHPHGPGFKISCSTCHSAKGWNVDKEIYSFDHNTTRLPLAGQHTKVDCKICHPTLVFSDAKIQCNECHTDVHQATVGPDCSRCHTQESWLVGNINELHQISRFPLLGAHRTADCFSCHKSESHARFDIPGINCIDCHRQNYMATVSPNHTNAGFSEDCTTCHPVSAFQWTGAGFNHNFFALIQGHAIPKCADCHTSSSYSDTKPECNSCHQTDYVAASNPNHTAANFPVTCEVCHSLAPGWKPASFDHTVFPLTLGHSNANCVDCHKGGNYNSTPTDCYACHQGNYDSSTNPNHKILGFSTVCTQCHTTNPGWKPAKYTQHDSQFFPIYSGRHNGQWTSCTDCHTNTADYSAFSCINCHTHNKTETDSRHSGVNGYSYNSTACYSCHPAGNAGD